MCRDPRRARALAPLLLGRVGRATAPAALALALWGCSAKPLTKPEIQWVNPGGTGSPALRVLEVTPQNSSVAVPPASPDVTAAMSWVLDGATVNDSTLTLTGPNGRVAGSVSVSQGAILVFTPSAPLESGTWYEAKVRAGVRGANGGVLAYDYDWAFETEDVIAPTVASVSPADGATEVATNATWAVTFSEPIDPSTAQVPANFHVTGPQGDVAGVVTFSSGGRTATFTPSLPLDEFETTYTLTLNGVRDATGNYLPGSNTYHFTTVVADPGRLYYVADVNSNRMTSHAGGASVTIDYAQAIPAQAWRITGRGDGTYELHSAALPASYVLDGGDGNARASMQDGTAPSRVWHLTRLGSFGSVYLLSLPATLGEGYLLGHCLGGPITLCMGARDDSRLYLQGWTLARVADQTGR